ncbi:MULTISPECIES: carotenoid oxygenase family protein [unclassified Sphingomonas]|nr:MULTISPECIES: carotenoid oxygenase family protein [unclassified Sphingomonas]
MASAIALDDTTDHPFLTGIHAPMRAELTLTELPVTGTIPAALNGQYMRIGPNPVNPDPKSYHWFIGDGMVHGLAIRDGKARWYRNRWIRSAAVAAALGESPAPGPRHGRFDTVNTNVVEIAGKILALVEAGSTPVALSRDMEAQSYTDFGGTLAGSFTAHPHRDPLTGEQHAITYAAMVPDTVHHVVLSPEGKVIREEPIAVAHGPSIHDCAITARFVVVLDLPVTFSLETAMQGRGFPYRWNPEHRARIGLLPRGGRGDETIWIEIDPCYIFHTLNAHDLPDGRVVLDAVSYDTMFAGEPGGPDQSPRGLERFVLDPVARTAERRILDAAPQEFPRPDERRFGQPHRHAYTIALPENGFAIAGTRLYKHDLETGTREVHDFGEGRHPGEFVFVPAAPDAAEDEGWLIGLVVDLPNETTDLAILDARDFAGAPVASIRLPHRVPPGFHGNWITG